MVQSNAQIEIEDVPSDPLAEVQAFVTDLWEQIFSEFANDRAPDEIGLDDDFFRIGGNSLLGMMMIARLFEDLEIEISFATLLDHPTVRDLSGQILSALTGAEEAETAHTLP